MTKTNRLMGVDGRVIKILAKIKARVNFCPTHFLGSQI